MEFRFIASTLFEIALVAFVIFGLFNESRFAETERRVWRLIKRRISAFFRRGLSREQY